MSRDLRNIAIIAHVDHGKTTLVDQLFRQSGTFRENQRVEERAMDSGDLEKERGITILAKCTSVEWEHDGTNTRINIVDTPGHADFGAEVERILSMVDGVILLVDAAEGPMPQTKFVTGKALALGLKPIVVVNKIDRSDARPDEVLDECFELFLSLDANDEQLDFPSLWASGRDGYASADKDARSGDLDPLFKLIVDHVPAPGLDPDGPFSFLATLLDRDNFMGRVLTGRIQSGTVRVNDPIHAIDVDGKVVEVGRATKLMSFDGLDRVPVETAVAGDIIALAGLEKATVSNTVADPSVKAPIPAQPIDPPTLAMRFSVNDSPLAGREGSKVTSRMIRDRLLREAETNVAIRVTEAADKDSFEVAGRGELQLGVLIETMRREGFELGISRMLTVLHAHPGMDKLLLKCGWSPDGKMVGVGSEDRMVYVYDVATRSVKYRLPGHNGAVTEVAFHPTEPIIGSCSTDKAVYVVPPLQYHYVRRKSVCEYPFIIPFEHPMLC